MNDKRKEYRRKWMAEKREQESVNTCEQSTESCEQKPVNTPEPVHTSPDPVNTREHIPVNKPIDWQNIPESVFDGHGRGVPVAPDPDNPDDRFVMISKGLTEDRNQIHGIITENTWRQRLETACTHGYQGWSCKQCL